VLTNVYNNNIIITSVTSSKMSHSDTCMAITGTMPLPLTPKQAYVFE